MIRKDKLMASRTCYAADLASFLGKTSQCQDGTSVYRGEINAVWFRRRRGVTIACIGTLDGSLYDFDAAPANAAEFLTRFTDSRWGGDCEARWDGSLYWGSQDPAEMERHLALLRPMLDNYPNVPDGHEGWYVF